MHLSCLRYGIYQAVIALSTAHRTARLLRSAPFSEVKWAERKANSFGGSSEQQLQYFDTSRYAFRMRRGCLLQPFGSECSTVQIIIRVFYVASECSATPMWLPTNNMWERDWLWFVQSDFSLTSESMRASCCMHPAQQKIICNIMLYYIYNIRFANKVFNYTFSTFKKSAGGCWKSIKNLSKKVYKFERDLKPCLASESRDRYLTVISSE